MVIVPLLLGGGVGLGLWLCLRGLRPRPEPVAAILVRLDRPGRAIASGKASPDAPGGLAGLARQLVPSVARAIAPVARPSPSLALLGRTAERHAVEKVAASLLGLVAPVLAATLLGSAGIAVPPGLAVLLAVGSAAGGWVLPDIAAADQARDRQRAFRHALSAYLDLVNILLAGGAGIETALFAAADAGEGWAFDMLRQALDRSRLTGQTPWETFADLGDALGVEELSELAASVALAGSHGARVRASLAAKADAVRGHQVAEAESAAEAATERMTIPVAVMLAGFLVFVAYPALLEVTSVT